MKDDLHINSFLKLFRRNRSCKSVRFYTSFDLIYLEKKPQNSNFKVTVNWRQKWLGLTYAAIKCLMSKLVRFNITKRLIAGIEVFQPQNSPYWLYFVIHC